MKQKAIDLKSATTFAISILDGCTSEDPHSDLEEMCEAFWAMRHPTNFIRKVFAAKWPNETITDILVSVDDNRHERMGAWLVTVKCGKIESYAFGNTLEDATQNAVKGYKPGPDIALILGVAA